MKIKILFFAILVFIFAGCSHSDDHEGHDHATEEHEGEEAHEGEAAHEGEEEVKFQYTAYNNSYELFAEADAFVQGQSANVLSHFSKLPSFKAVEEGKITITLTVNGKETSQTLENPTRKGIYSFDITPETAGKGTLKFIIDTSIIEISDILVFTNIEEAHEVAESNVVSKTNTVVFTKEQSWKIDFQTDYPNNEPFGQVIKTVAKIEPTSGNETVISAKTSGIVIFSNNNILEGNNVNAAQKLFAISSSGMSENNIVVRITEAKSNYENAEADYKRHLELAIDKIISEKEVQSAKNLYENTKAVYENLINNFSSTGQNITSPLSGFVKQIFITNGQYVEAGQPLITISQNQTLVLSAYTQQKYISVLSSIVSANIRTLYDNKTYTFEELNGRVLSYGKSATADNYLIPVNIQIDNKGSFVQGSFVEVYLKTITNSQAITVPNTALLEEQGFYYVFVQVTPELFEKREIKIGVTDGLKTEILSGISATERIITKGAMLVKLAQASGALDPHAGHVH